MYMQAGTRNRTLTLHGLKGHAFFATFQTITTPWPQDPQVSHLVSHLVSRLYRPSTTQIQR